MSGFKQVFRTAITAVNSTEIDNLGDLRWDSNKLYKYVELYNTSATVAVVKNNCVAYDTTVGPGGNRVVSDWSDADTIPVGAGMIQAAAAGTQVTSFYLWILLTGDTGTTVITPTPTSVAIGETVTTHATTDMLLITTAALEDETYGTVIAAARLRADFPV